jgi:hypothetical protein
MYFIRSFLSFSAISISMLAAGSAAAQQNYEPVPPGFDFPADEATLLRFRDTQNVPEMRRHSWYVFAGLTQRAKNGEAIWETWFPLQATFQAGPQPQGLTGAGPARVFEAPRQLQQKGAQPQAVGESNLSFVLLNKDTNDFIRSNGLHLQSRLTELNNGFPAGTPIEKREVTAFPRTAMSLKLGWRIVRATGFTLIPVWDGRPTLPDAQGNPPSSWPRVVVVDPSRDDIPLGETRAVNWQGNPAFPARVVSLTRFYRFKITAAEIDSVRRVMGANAADIGDYAVFMMMHFTTKEIPEWVWSTFWWHDQPDGGPFGSDRPTAVQGVWRNYMMDTSYSMDTPREYDGSPNSVFNPYLENFPGGIGSNCMTCHRQARWTKDGNPGFEVTRGTPPANDPMFVDALKTDFLWSIPDRAQ